MAIGRREDSRTFWYMSAGACLVFSLGCLNGGGDTDSEDTDGDGDISPTNNNSPNNGLTNNSDGCPDLDPSALQSGDVTLEEGCYDAPSGIFKLDGTLTIEPGVTVYFAMGTELNATGGKVSAVGTADKPIVFTSREETPGVWRGVKLARSRSADNVFDFVEIRYSGGQNSAGALTVEGDTLVDIKNTTIADNSTIGLLVRDAETDITVSSTTLQDNDQSIAIHAANIEGLASDLTLEDNMAGHVEILGTSVDEETTWPTLAEPYYFPVADSALRIGELLTLSPGTTIIFAQNSGLNVEGGNSGLNALGTMEAPITLTGDEQTRGYWRGVQYKNSNNSSNALDWVRLEYAGNGQWSGDSNAAGGLFVVAESRVTVSNCTFEENNFAGLHVAGGDNDISVSSSSFSSNLRPIVISSNLVGDLTGDLAFEGNDTQEVFVYGLGGSGGGSLTKDQTWPVFDVPYRIFNGSSTSPNSSLNVEAKLTLLPGTVLNFEQNMGLFILGTNSALIADASGGDPIVMQASTGMTAPGSWRGVALENSRSTGNTMANVQILYGGGSMWDGGGDSAANLFFRVSSDMAIADLTLTGSGSGIGLSIRDDSELTSCSNLMNDGTIRQGSDVLAADADGCPVR
ncbi:MAG: hypothetical protein AAGI01_12925 [Myxococcota bacterium]